MRKIILDIANVVVTVLVGGYLVLLTLTGAGLLKAVPEVLASSLGIRILFFLVGAGLLYLNINELVKELKSGALRRILRITTDQGTTEFFVPSLEMQVQRELRMEPDIVDPVVMLTPHGEGKPIECKVELKLRNLKDSDNIKRSDGIKKKVRDIIDRLVSGHLTVDVLVDVRDFVSESTRTSSRQDRSRLPESGEFNGPVYTNQSGSEGV